MHSHERQSPHARNPYDPNNHRAYRTPQRRQGPNLRLTSLLATGVVAGIMTASLAVAHTAAGASGASGGPALVPMPSTNLSAYSEHLSKHLQVEKRDARKLRQRQERQARLRRERARHRAQARRQRIAAAQPSGTPQQIAHTLVLQRGWSEAQFSCLDQLWARESGWDVYASNASSGAYGIPQALPGTKMAAAGPDWQTSALTQIRWGLDYIAGSYGDPCNALAHSNATGYY